MFLTLGDEKFIGMFAPHAIPPPHHQNLWCQWISGTGPL